MQNSPKTLKEHLIRLEKYVASLGIASRREAKTLILKGLIQVNGEIIKNPGYGIDVQKDTLTSSIDIENPKEYILIYKPRGIETSNTGSLLKDIHDTYPQYKHLSPIGRLDAESEGLIILSNDGVLAKKLTQKETHIGKTYRVTVREHIEDGAIQRMSRGILLSGEQEKTKPAQVKKISTHVFEIILHEGRKHQIRRMADAVQLTVERLIRVAIGDIVIGQMQSGEVRKLSRDEVDVLKSL